MGGVAAAVRDDAPDTVTFAVFAAMTLPFIAALVAIVLDRTEHPEQAEDSIECQWATRASSGAFYDTMVAMGLATFATSVLDTASLPAVALRTAGPCRHGDSLGAPPASGGLMDNQLRALREGAGLSQADCAHALGVSRQTVISIEKGHFDPRLSLAFRIGRLFAVPVDEVFVPDVDLVAPDGE